MSVFKFKHFLINQSNEVQKVGTDSMLLGAIIEHINPTKILDIGSGTGVLSLMMAQKYIQAAIYAVDINPFAFDLTQENFNNSPFSNKFNAFNCDFNDFKPSIEFDLIVTNPPYFNASVPSPKINRAIARHETKLSFSNLIEHTNKLLSNNGAFWLIIPYDRSNDFIHSATSKGMSLKTTITVLGKPNKPKRSVLCFVKTKIETPTESMITVRNESGNYTEEYKMLTKDFHAVINAL